MENNYKFEEVDLETTDKLKPYSIEKEIEVLYKYCPLNQYTYENLKSGKLYLSPVSMLNDACEFISYIDVNFVWKILNDVKNSVDYDSYIKTGELNLPESIYNNMKVNNWNKSELQEMTKSVIIQLRNVCKVTSLTTDGESPAMWGQYGDYNQGIMIEYELNDIFSKNTQDMITGQVDYSDEKVDTTIAFIEIMFEDKGKVFSNQTVLLATKNSLTKYKKWSYEKEIRSVKWKANQEIDEFLDVIPVSITFGIKTPPKEIIKLVEFIKENNLDIKLYYAEVQNLRKYNVERIIYTDQAIENTRNYVNYSEILIFKAIIENGYFGFMNDLINLEMK